MSILYAYRLTLLTVGLDFSVPFSSSNRIRAFSAPRMKPFLFPRLPHRTSHDCSLLRFARQHRLSSDSRAVNEDKEAPLAANEREVQEC